MANKESEQEFDERLTKEVTLLSTKLVTAVAKQSELEEKLLHMFKENTRMKQDVERLKVFEQKYEESLPTLETLEKDMKEALSKKEIAEAENSRLQAEVEDLTASLFNEANEMVSNASRETYNYKVKNQKLQEEIKEKDTIINDLQSQLKDLKDMLMKLDDMSSVARSDNSAVLPLGEDSAPSAENDNSEADRYKQQLSTFIYSPMVRALRFDLSNYNLEFKEFIYNLISTDFKLDLSNLKNFKYFKKVWNEELEDCLPQIPSFANLKLINRWQKGKTFWNVLVDGKVVIEPVSGINEHFKVTYMGEILHNGSNQPVAIAAACSFCGENKDDMLEHCRLHVLKIVSQDLFMGSHSADEEQLNYPLCNYCLVKLRNICELFARLRQINSNVYKLKQNPYFSNLGTQPNFQFKSTFANMRDSESHKHDSHSDNRLVEGKPGAVDEDEETKLRKIYCMLTLIRAKIFWSKIGFWDNLNLITQVDIDELHNKAFKYIVDAKIVGENEITKDVLEPPSEIPAEAETSFLKAQDAAYPSSKNNALSTTLNADDTITKNDNTNLSDENASNDSSSMKAVMATDNFADPSMEDKMDTTESPSSFVSTRDLEVEEETQGVDLQ